MTTRMSRYTRAGALLLGLLLAGCGSTPQSNHYLLSAGKLTPPVGDSPTLGLGPIEIPEYLRRNGLVYHREDHVVRIANSERWAEPLEDGIARVVTLNLASLLDTQNVQQFPWHPKREPNYGIKIRVMSLNATDTEALLVVEWLVYTPETGEPISRRISQLRRPLPGGGGDPALIAPAYSDLLFELSELIAAAIRSDMAGASEVVAAHHGVGATVHEEN